MTSSRIFVIKTWHFGHITFEKDNTTADRLSKNLITHIYTCKRYITCKRYLRTLALLLNSHYLRTHITFEFALPLNSLYLRKHITTRRTHITFEFTLLLNLHYLRTHIKALLHCAVFSTTCLAMALRDKLLENCTV